MGDINIIFVAAAVLTWALLLSAVGGIIFKEGMIEVKPNRAIVVNNIWTGSSASFFQGTKFLIPGIQKKLKDVTLENEPSNPDITKAVTADGTEIGVNYVITVQCVSDPVLAVTRINYDKRVELINVRLRALFQDELSGLKMEDLLFSDSATEVLSKDKMKKIEKDVNEAYATLEADKGKSWGIQVEIQLVNLLLPTKLAEVAEEAATAKKEGERIATKAKAAGVPPWLMAAGDILYDLTREKSGRKTNRSEK